MSVTTTSTGSCRYIFSDESAIEKERLKRLNELYNKNTMSVLEPHVHRAACVLEVGPGTGEIGSWIAGRVGQKNYTALDSSRESVDALRALLPDATCLSGSVTEIDTLDALKGKKFDVVFIRWVLAYIPKEEQLSTIKVLFDRFVAENGALICEECDVYKVHCITNDASQTRVDISGYREWLELTRNVQALEGVHADFEIGSSLQHHFEKLNVPLSIHEFQPILADQYSKEIPVLAMKAAKTFLAGKKVRNEEELDRITSMLAEVAINPALSVRYLKNTLVVASKKEAQNEGVAYREFLNDQALQQSGALGL